VIGVVLVAGMVLVAVAAPLISRYDPAAQGVGPALAGPSVEHWFGTDRFGRDLAARVFHGGRTTLMATGLVLALVVVVGTALGAVAASLGSAVDKVARQVFDLLVAFPVMVVALAFVGLWGPSLPAVLTGVLLVLWAHFARLSRSLVRAALAEPSAVAARALGAGRWMLLRREVWPRLRGPVFVLAAVEAAQLIGVVAGLSFLGLGAQPPSAEWGAMLQEGRAALWSAPHLVVVPGVAVLLTVLGLTCIGEGLQEAS
jgi:peptide/nickel transport system permease protein